MTRPTKIASHEPVLLAGLVRLSIIIALHFGVKLEGGQVLALYATLEAVFGTVARQLVTPTAKLEGRR